MKTCNVCLTSKPVGDYYLAGNGSPASVCKECHKARMKHRSLTNPKVQEYDRARSKTPDRRMKAAIISKKWRSENPTGYKAQTAVSNAVRDGRLLKGPCSLCGTTNNVHGHHKDYSKPLDVVWLCAKCHHRVHSTFPELGGGFDRQKSDKRK